MSSPLASCVLLVSRPDSGASRGRLGATGAPGALWRSEDRALTSDDLFKETRDGSLWTVTHTHTR